MGLEWGGVGMGLASRGRSGWQCILDVVVRSSEAGGEGGLAVMMVMLSVLVSESVLVSVLVSIAVAWRGVVWRGVAWRG